MKTIKNILIGLLIIAILFFSGFFTKQLFFTKCPELITITDTIPGDSIPYEVKVRIPVPILKVIHDTTWKYKNIDTLAILQAYYNITYTKDTIIGSDIRGSIYEAISCNSIIDRKINLQNTRETSLSTTFIDEQKNSVYVGLSGYFGSKSGVGPSARYVTKKWAAGGGYDIINKQVILQYEYNLRNLFK